MGLELNVAFVPNFNIYMIQYYLCHIICIVFYLLTLTSYSCCKGLFADAEVGEDFAEDVVGADFTCDFAEVVHTFADVLAYEVAAEAAVEAVDAA